MKQGKITGNRFHITQRKLPHWQIGGSWYFVTFRTKGIVLAPGERDMVAEAILHDHKIRYELAIAVVMPDHVHIMLRPLPDDAGNYHSLKDILRLIKGVSSNNIKRKMGTKQAIWQSESFDRIVRNPDEWRGKYEYIRNNAGKAGFAEKPEDYPWLLNREDFLKHW